MCQRQDDGSRMSREAHVRFCEGLRVKLPWSTHPLTLTRWIDVHDRPNLVSFRGITGNIGRQALLEGSQNKIDMAKSKMIEPQRVSVLLKVASSVNGAMGFVHNCVELCERCLWAPRNTGLPYT